MLKIITFAMMLFTGCVTTRPPSAHKTYIVTYNLATSLRTHAWEQGEADYYGLHDYATSTSGMHGKPYPYVKKEKLSRGFYTRKEAEAFIEKGRTWCDDLSHYFYRAKYYILSDFEIHERHVKIFRHLAKHEDEIPFHIEITYNCCPTCEEGDPHDDCVGWSYRFEPRQDHK